MSHKKRIIDSAQQYLSYGWNPIALRSRKKRPAIREWQNHSLKEDDVEQHFRGEYPNIGVLLGASSKNLVDIDLDCREACLLAPDILPHTDAIFGRESKPASHYLYRCDTPADTIKFSTADHGMLVELRSNGMQTMFPPSVHPSGETLRFESNHIPQPSTVAAERLEAAVTLLAVAAYVVKSYPSAGNRNQLALCLAGGLLRTGRWTVSEIEHVITAIARTAGDEEWEERAKVVAATKEKLDAGQAVTGIPSLATLIGDKPAKKVQSWCGLIPEGPSSDASQLIERMNQDYALILIGGKSSVAKIQTVNGMVEIECLSTTAFRDYFCNHHIHRNGKLLSHAEYWFKHPDRRTYDGITFEPGAETPKRFNLWQGFSVNAVEGDCSLFLKHTREVICGGSDELYAYVIGWLAAIVQKPREKVGTALVIRGKQGAGKSLWVRYFSSLIAPYCVIAESPHLITGRFNGHLQHCLLLHAEEGFWAGDKTAESKLKELITGDVMTIELKGKEPFSSPNSIRLLVTGNPNWMVPAAFEERRFAVLEASDAHLQDHAYFESLNAEMRNGGKEALLHFLLNYDLSSINLKAIPKTAALLEQKFSSMDSLSAWWLDILHRGELPHREEWVDRVAVSDLVHDYIEHAHRTGERRRAIETEFGRRMKKFLPSLEKGKGDALRWCLHEKKLFIAKTTYYRLPTLQQCREAFEKILGQAVDWDDPEGNA